jgi:hypothetical protein
MDENRRVLSLHVVFWPLRRTRTGQEGLKQRWNCDKLHLSLKELMGNVSGEFQQYLIWHRNDEPLLRD